MPRRDPDARRGALGALVANLTPVDTREESPRELAVDSLTPSRFQPRRHFDEAALGDLAASVRERGVLQPLLVRPFAGGYEIVAGERRWRAARLAGLATVPVVVRELSDDEAQDAAAVENLQRADLDVIDEVDLTVALVARVLGLPQQEVPARLHVLVNRPGEDPEDVARLEALFTGLGRGTWTSFVKNKLRVLRWPAPVLAAMRQHGLGYSLAGVIAAAPGAQQGELLDLALGGATRAHLRERLLSFRKDKPADPAAQVARALRDRRRLDTLGAKERRRAETLLRELARLLGETTEAG